VAIPSTSAKPALNRVSEASSSSNSSLADFQPIKRFDALLPYSVPECAWSCRLPKKRR